MAAIETDTPAPCFLLQIPLGKVTCCLQPPQQLITSSRNPPEYLPQPTVRPPSKKGLPKALIEEEDNSEDNDFKASIARIKRDLNVYRDRLLDPPVAYLGSLEKNKRSKKDSFKAPLEEEDESEDEDPKIVMVRTKRDLNVRLARRRHPAVLRTNRQIHEEASSLMY